MMRKILALIVFGAALSLVGYAAAESADPGTEAAKPLIRCSTCGVTFTSSAGLIDHYKAHPEHMASNAGSATNVIKCSTCGVEFTSKAGAEDHVKANPSHVLSAAPLLKCSTCGVEFTSLGGAEEHLKAHPEHVVVPVK